MVGGNRGKYQRRRGGGGRWSRSGEGGKNKQGMWRTEELRGRRGKLVREVGKERGLQSE